jgi:hypothetical protein
MVRVDYPYSAVYGFWPVEDLAELSDGPTGSGAVVRVVCV